MKDWRKHVLRGWFRNLKLHLLTLLQHETNWQLKCSNNFLSADTLKLFVIFYLYLFCFRSDRLHLTMKSKWISVEAGKVAFAGWENWESFWLIRMKVYGKNEIIDRNNRKCERKKSKVGNSPLWARKTVKNVFWSSFRVSRVSVIINDNLGIVSYSG